MLNVQLLMLSVIQGSAVGQCRLYWVSQKTVSSTFVDITVMHANFWLKFYTIWNKKYTHQLLSKYICNMETVPVCIWYSFKSKLGSASWQRTTKECSYSKRPKCWKLEINFSKVVQQHYVGKVGKSTTFVLHIISVYSVPNIVEIGQHM